MVISSLLNAVTKGIAGSLLYMDTTQAVWTKLHDMVTSAMLHDFSAEIAIESAIARSS